MVGKIVGGLIGVVVIGLTAVNLWPTFVGSDTSVQALTQSDVATTTFQALWPVVVIIGGIGIGVAAIYWVLKEFGIMS